MLFLIFQEKIDWDLNVYVPGKYYCKKLLSYSKLTNPFIHYIPLNHIEYNGYECFRIFFYHKGLTMPRPQTIANMAIYVGLNNSYSEINVYGVDHSFFDSLCVNENNQLCNRYGHFYEKGQIEPIIRPDNGMVWKISDYLEAISFMMKSHDQLADYAVYLNVKIINYTKNSMIDSYERRNNIECQK